MRERIKQSRVSVVRILKMKKEANTLSFLIIGTGFLVNDKGLVATANHVVNSCPKDCTLVAVKADATNVDIVKDKAEIFKVDAAHDLALLKVPALENIKPLQLGDVSKVEEGDDVLFMGFPMSQIELTSGRAMISAKVNKPIFEGKKDVEQLKLDASINMGNSGGPVISIETGLVANRACASATELWVLVVDLCLQCSGDVSGVVSPPAPFS